MRRIDLLFDSYLTIRALIDNMLTRNLLFLPLHKMVLTLLNSFGSNRTLNTKNLLSAAYLYLFVTYVHEFTVKHYATVSTGTKKHNGVNRSQTNQKIRSAFLSGRPHKSNTY